MRKILPTWLTCRKRHCAVGCQPGNLDCEKLPEGDSDTLGKVELWQLGGDKSRVQDLVSDGAIMSRARSLSPQMNDITDSKETIHPIFLAIQNGDTDLLEEILEESNTANTARYGGQSPLHSTCYTRNLYALTRLVQHDCKVEAVDQLGHTPLHVAVDEAWHEGVKELLRYGASPNTLSEPPATVREVRMETPLHAAVRRGDLISTTLLLQQHPDLTLLDSESCSVLHLAAHARSIEITRLLLHEKSCQELVGSSDKDGNSVLHRALLRPCDPAEEGVVKMVVGELTNAGANVNATNKLRESSLYLAAQQQLSHVVDDLVGSGADPTLLTTSGQSVLHAACRQGSAACLTVLLQLDQVKRLVTTPDNEGHEPFYYAVHSGSIDSCELLLTHGDHLTRVDKNGMSRFSIILKHLPSATQLLKRLFDAHVRLSNLPHHDANYRITFDYSVLYQEAEGVQSSLISELSNSNLEALLKHPLLESFLFFKWCRIKPFFYFSVVLYFLFLILHTIFIIMTFGGNPWSWSEHIQEFTIFLILHITMFLLILIPDLIIMVANFKKYLNQWETFSKAMALFSSAFVIFSYITPLQATIQASQLSNITANNTTETITDPGSLYVQMLVVRHAAAISAFFCWVEFMMLLGRFPSLGSYVLMFTRVARSIIKFLAAFSSLIIGFAVSFMVLFKHKYYFSTFPLSLMKTLMMMIGEIDYGDVIDGMELPVLGCLFLVFFLFLVCVLLANLLIGLAVNDLPDLQRQGKIKRLSKQASYLVSYERLMRVAHSLRCFPRQLRILMTSRCKIPQSVSVLPNKDNSSPNRKKDNYHLPSETLHEAILLGTEDLKVDFPTLDEEEDIVTQFRSFKVKYARDRRQLYRRLAQLPDITTIESIITQHLNRMEQTLHQQLLQISLQMYHHTSTTPFRQYSNQVSHPSQLHQPLLIQSPAGNNRQQQQPPSQQLHTHLVVQDSTQSQPPGIYSSNIHTQTNADFQPIHPSPLLQTPPVVLQSGAHHYSVPLQAEHNITHSLQPQPLQQATTLQPPGTQDLSSQEQLPQEHSVQPLPTQQQTQTHPLQQLEQDLIQIMTHPSTVSHALEEQPLQDLTQ